MAVMMTPRERWTDERLDDLNEKVDRGFAKMDARFERLEARFEHLEVRLDAKFERLDAKFDALNKILIGSAVAVIVALIGSAATLAGIAFL